MCSIAGILEFKETNRDKVRLIKTALSTLINRGPDEEGLREVNSYCVMAGNRLKIRGASFTGSLPFLDKRNACFYNGEIYNYSKWDKNVSTDGEVLLPLFKRFGIDFLKKLDGEFAVSIWDAEKEQIILATDPFGIKPVYFSLSADQLIWASSETAINTIIEHPLCSMQKSPTFIHSQSIQTPYTSYSGIWLIPPGHYILASRTGISIACYNKWKDGLYNSSDTNKTFSALEESLTNRMQYSGPIAIPLSSGIDSGIIAFMADRLKLNYQIFTVDEMFNERTVEAEYIYERLNKLKHANGITILKCNQKQYNEALSEIYSPDYYVSEKYDGGAIPMHTVVKAVHDAGLKVLIDGTGGDELFHGYTFRNDFTELPGFPNYWSKKYMYSILTTLVDFTAKSDRAGAHFSIETRYPFQTKRIANTSANLLISETLKWPLRKFLLNKTKYGQPNIVDREKKFGFMLERIDRWDVVKDMKKAWLHAHDLSDHPKVKPMEFPFKLK